MGIPKFFRFMSERYPLISQLIQENRIPGFDALYLDMNGIIHNCSHPNDNDASFRITEEEIFLAVFAYVTHLFSVIKPKKMFFLAVDGVAPRAKMNQQRSRRFRTAKETKETIEKAKAKGEEIPEGDGFDSNCITPGTPFMARLSEQLKYFIAKKVSEDADWRGVEIVLSGHEVPGEGEHKIMEYIRLNKAQPDYDPNVRHCLYGLDADLIMLGLLSHDPHFCLLREEVTFGRASKGKVKGLESQNFFLLHLSLFREYLDLEFASLKTSQPPLPFEYDLERIIDDFILLNIFIGNDFLPHLPGLHINEGALGRLFEIYKRILPLAGGYLNEHGILNVKRLQLVLNELTVFEQEHFEHEFADSSWFKGKQSKHVESTQRAKARGQLVVTKEQKKIFNQVRLFIQTNLPSLSPNHRLELPNTLTSRDRKFLSDLADSLKLTVSYDEFDQAGDSLIVVAFDPELMAIVAAEDEDEEEDDDDYETTDDDGEEEDQAREIPAAAKNGNGTKPQSDPEWKQAIDRILKKYGKAEVVKDISDSDGEDDHAKMLQGKMDIWKREYYREKLNFEFTDTKALHDLAFRYIEGLQWVLHYYYSGVASWGWFYDYHYAPKISDLNEASTYTFNFEMGKPFLPFEQLMGVLPDLSSQHIPVAFRDLMSDPTSPIIDFYPVNFVQDLNGKKSDWEAIVKIPFIEEKRLLETLAMRAPKLTPEERKRNSFGNSWHFVYVNGLDYNYASSLPGFFPDLIHCHCKVEPFNLPTLEGGLVYCKGLVAGVLLGKDAISGFPSMHTIPHRGQLSFHGINVFQTTSQKETMVITLDHVLDGIKVEDVANLLVDKVVYTGYPYLQESTVIAISDELFRYEIENHNGIRRVRSTPHHPGQIVPWKRAADRIEHQYSTRYGVVVGQVEVIAHVKLLKGLRRLEDGAQVKDWEENEQEFALQAIVTSVSSEDVRYREQPPIPVEVEYPEGSKVFFLGAPAFGVPAQVTGHEGNLLSIRAAFFPTDKFENDAFKSKIFSRTYSPAHVVSRQVRMSGLALAKITASLFITQGEQKTNIGLNLKFEAKGQKVLGYTQKGDHGWEFSEKAVKLVQDYNLAFPEIAGSIDRKRGGDLLKATDFFDPQVVDAKVKALKAWLVEQGVRDFDRVPLYSEQLDKAAVEAVEKLEDQLASQKVVANLKQAFIKNIPRSALLKPAHAATRLQDQQFFLGDRVMTVAETGSVPLSAKGVVVGIQTGFIDVVFDVQFIGGTTLDNRCSAYRGQTVAPNTILNLTTAQFVVQTRPSPAVDGHGATMASRGRGNPNAFFAKGPRGGPSIVPARGLPAGGFHPAPAPVQRGRMDPHGVQVLHKTGRVFDGNYGAVARGEAGPVSVTPATFSHQQQLGAALGIPTNGHHANHSTFAGRGRGTSGLGSHRGGNQLNMLMNAAQQQQNHPEYTPAHRGAMRGAGSIRGAVSVGKGVAIPPPSDLNAPSVRGAARGGRGGRGGHVLPGDPSTATNGIRHANETKTSDSASDSYVRGGIGRGGRGRGLGRGRGEGRGGGGGVSVNVPVKT